MPSPAIRNDRHPISPAHINGAAATGSGKFRIENANEASATTCVANSAVLRIAREKRKIAKVFAASHTVRAVSARMPEPGNADALADLVTVDIRPDHIDDADDFVARNDRPLRVWKITIDDVKIRPADRASFNANADLPLLRGRIGSLFESLEADRQLGRPWPS